VVAGWLSQLPPAAADEAALRPLPRRDALGDAAKLAVPQQIAGSQGNAGRAGTEFSRAAPCSHPLSLAGRCMHEAAAAL
jgi:hypothetical protein